MHANAFCLTIGPDAPAAPEAAAEPDTPPPATPARAPRSYLASSPPWNHPAVTPQVDRELRVDRAYRKDEEGVAASELPDMGWKEQMSTDPDEAAVYSLAFRAITARVLRNDKYCKFRVARDVKRKLPERE